MQAPKLLVFPNSLSHFLIGEHPVCPPNFSSLSIDQKIINIFEYASKFVDVTSKNMECFKVFDIYQHFFFPKMFPKLTLPAIGYKSVSLT